MRTKIKNFRVAARGAAFGAYTMSRTYFAGSGLTLTDSTFSLTTASLTLNGHSVSLGGSLSLTLADISADPLAVAHGGTNASSASGTALDNITGFSSTGFLKRTGAGTYSFIADPLPVVNGGTGIASGTSGGIPYFSGATSIASSALLAAGQVVVGGGSGAAPATIANGQLPATTTNDNAAAGKVGEYVASTVAAASAVSLSNGVPANLTTISLTAGDWDVFGNVNFIPTGTATAFESAVNSSSASFPDESQRFEVTGSLTSNYGAPCPMVRFSLSSPATVYLVAYAVFGSGTVTCCGQLLARRVR